MAKKVGDIDESKIKQIRADALGLVNDLDSIGKSINSSLETVSKLTGESVKSFKEQFSAANALGDAISKVDAKTLASKKSQVSFEDKVRKAQEEATKLETKALRLKQESVNFSKAQAREAYKVARAYEDGADKLREQARAAGKITSQFEKLNQQTKIFDDVAEFFNQIPGISKVFGEFQKASDSARDAASEGGNAFIAGAKQLGGAFTKIASAFTIDLLITGLTQADQRMVSLGRDLNKTTGESENLVKSFNKAAKASGGILGKDAQAAAEGLSKALGTTGIVSEETGVEMANNVKFLGMSADEAEKLAKFTASQGGNLKNVNAQMRGEVIISNARNKTAISYQSINKDIANSSNAIKLSTAGTGKNITQAALAAKKLGLDLAGVDKIADSLLNFESSIQSEMEAELLTGQELNLEEARRLALNNDLEGVANEIAKNQKVLNVFATGNRIQQEAIAKSMGMSRDEMANMIVEQKALANFGAKDKTELNDKVKLQLEQVEALKKQGKLDEAKVLNAKISEQLGNDELKRQIENQTMAEKQALATGRMAESMDKLLLLIKPISAFFGFIADHADIIVKALLLITGSSMLSKFSKLTGMFSNLGKGMGSVATAATGVGKAVMNAGAKNPGSTVSGAAAASAVKAGTATAASTATTAAASGGGSFFGNIAKSAKGLVSKLNPLTAVKGAVKAGGGIGGFLKNALKKIPMLNTILTGFFAYNDIKDLIANPVDADGNKLSDNKLAEEVGKIVAGGLGGILGGAVGTAVGGPLGTIVGSMGGDWLFKNLLGLFPEAAAGLGSAVIPFFKDSGTPMVMGGIVPSGYPNDTFPAKLSSGEAVVSIDKLYAKFDQLIKATQQGKDVSLNLSGFRVQ